jgi:hypothetical protein
MASRERQRPECLALRSLTLPAHLSVSASRSIHDRAQSGTDALTVRAGDGGPSTSASVAIAVKSAAEHAADLKAQVTALKNAEVLSSWQALVLNTELNLQGTALDVLRVRAFLVPVRVYRELGLLTAAQADALLGPGHVLLLSVSRR